MKFTIWPKSWGRALLNCLVIPLVLEGCYAAMPFQYTNYDLKPYYDDYMIMVKERCRSNQYFHPNKMILIIKNIKQNKDYNPNTDGRIVGECTYLPSTFFEIDVDKQTWEYLTELDRKAIMFHELRHCVFMIDNHSLDPNNYFYADLPGNLTESKLYQQVIDDINNSCGVKK